MQLSISINPLNPKNNQHQVSPYNNTAESFIWNHVNKGNDHQLKKLSIVKQILLVSTLGNVKLTVWRIKILVLRWKELKESNSGKKNISYLAFQTIQESDLTFCAYFVWKI